MNGKTTPRDIPLFPHLLWEWSPSFVGMEPASHWWLRLGASGLSEDKASSQTCHYFLATVQMGRRDVQMGRKPIIITISWMIRVSFRGKKTLQNSIGSPFCCHIALPLMNNMEYPPFVDVFLFGKGGFVLSSLQEGIWELWTYHQLFIPQIMPFVLSCGPYLTERNIFGGVVVPRIFRANFPYESFKVPQLNCLRSLPLNPRFQEP